MMRRGARVLGGRKPGSPGRFHYGKPAPDFGPGACADHPFLDPSAWTDPGNEEDTTEARYVCDTQCPVRAECLAWAVRHKEHDGIWGGKTPGMRAHPEVRRRALACIVEDVR